MKQAYINCVVCNKKFFGYISNKYCSGKCLRSNTKILICKKCNKEFQGKTAIYCSQKCRPRGYHPYRGSTHKKVPPKKLNCAICDAEFETANKSKITCSDECSKRQRNRRSQLAKHRRNKVKTDLTVSLEKLIIRDKNTCYLCKKKCDINDFKRIEKNYKVVGANYPTIEHIVPLSQKGQHTWDNIKLACHYCNSSKSNRDIFAINGQLTFSI